MGWINRFISILMAPVRAVAYLFARVVPGLKRVTTISLPARLALFSFLALLITGIAVLIHFRLMSDRYKDWPDWLDDWRLTLLVIALIALVPVCIYLAVELLMRGEQSRYPDLDDAWQAGLTALRDNEIDLAATPLFLVIGEGDSTHAAQFHAAARIHSSVSGASAGIRPLQWFANNDAIFLHVNGASSLSKLARNRKATGDPASPGGGGPQYLRTISGDAPGVSSPGDLAGTMAVGNAPVAPPFTAGGPPAAPVRAMQTLVPGTPIDAGQPPPSPRAEITQRELDQFADRLNYVCGLARRHRAPVCALNGLVALLPLESVAGFHDQLRIALGRDLATVVEATRMRFAIALVVTEIENDGGFKEMMRRFTSEEIERGRIGSKYGNGDTDVWTPATRERLEHLANSACKNIVDNIRQFYSRSDALQRPGNGKLFALLSKIRGELGGRMEKLIVGGLANPGSMPAGCYFAAAGESGDRQGFLASVVQEKVISNRGKLSWLPSATRENQRWLLLSNLCALVTLVSIVALVFMLVKDIFFQAS